MSSVGTTIHPSRQPVIEKYFEKLLMVMALAEHAAAVVEGKPYSMP